VKNTGFKFDKEAARKRFNKTLAAIDAKNFEPELREFLGRALKTASKLTPTRDLQLIKHNQEKQYYDRTHYIQSVHWRDDPRLIVRVDGQQFLFVNGKWYLPLVHHLPDNVWNEYAPLEAELRRRLDAREAPFIKERAQARYLYRRSWWEVGQSVGIDIGASQGVIKAHSRHNPPKTPPKGYAQLRGGGNVLSFVIYNPLLNIPSRYIQFDAASILEEATQKHRSNFQNALGRKVRQLIPKN
jgi:hypothetical protein